MEKKEKKSKQLYQELLKAAAYLRKDDLKVLEKAYVFASNAHKGQKRASGSDFMIHPLQAAISLTILKVDEETLAAALLHDVVEDTPVSLEDIVENFGKSVARLVDGVTKLTRVKYKINYPDERDQAQIESLRKMLLVMAQDLRVVLIKLADRLHNMHSLSYFLPEKRIRIAKETLEIYAPLADRLGIWDIKWQLEDQAFRYLYPLEYKKLATALKASLKERRLYIGKVKKVLEQESKKAHIRVQVSGRTKHFYSIYRKMCKKHKDLDEIYDIFALRVVVKNVADCYSVLGLIHDLWRPKPGRFKDYIAVPKPNGYQSLHTTVFGVNGVLTEFQIRTQKMHEEAEYGISSHWYYKEKGNKNMGKAPVSQMEWVKNIVDLQNNFKNSSEFIEGLKIDVFKDRIFVFTPQGDVRDLPAGSTCIDFAYSIHTELGHSVKGAKVNGAMVTIDTLLQTGDLVEIISHREIEGPKRDWLNFVVTSQAKNKIRAWFKSHARESNIYEGREIVNKKLLQVEDGLTLQKLSKARVKKALNNMAYDNLDSILAAVGEGSLNAGQFIKKLFNKSELLGTEPADKKQIKVVSQEAKKEVLIEGESNLVSKFANCCNPNWGDQIIGYVTRGRGVSIHRSDCSSLKRLDPERILHAQWKKDIFIKAKAVKIRVEGQDRLGLFAEIGAITAKLGLNIIAATAHVDPKNEKRFIDEVTVEIKDFDDLEKLIYKFEKMPGVEKVTRL